MDTQQYTTDANQILVFSISGTPTVAYMDCRLWISLTRMYEFLGTVEWLFLLTNSELKILDDLDGGVYVPWNDFVSICPRAKQIELSAAKNKYLALAKGGE